MMPRITRIFLCTCVLLFSASILRHSPLFSQMPGWLTIKAPDGTVYFLDQAMKLHPAVDPENGYRIISKDSLGFCFTEADELIRLHRKSDALRIFKAVRYLSSLDPSISITGAKATAKINLMSRKEKERFPLYDRDSAILLVKNGATVYSHHESSGYTFSSPGTIAVLKQRITGNSTYMLDAAAFGVTSSGDGSGGFDTVVTVSSETFRNEFDSAEIYEAVYRNKTRDDTFTREKIASTRRTILYRFEGGSPAAYSGYEKLYAYGTRCFVVRAFAPKGRSDAEALAKKIIEQFSVGGAEE